ncbi:MAG TPA: type II toxin-antitoxin system VapC family toxin [Thermoanaerobaculia bacterium]|nr:type II toxin-antitoxin system VapC family toxin [Thermoanaerobaculia bacterium]
MPRPSHLVLDASLAIRALVPTSPQDRALELIAAAHQEGTALLAPDLWVSEVTSVLRKMVHTQSLAPEEADLLLSGLPSLGVQVIPSDLPLARSALSWAGRLGQIRAYDAFYLALAEREEATLWTGDGRLKDRVAQLGIDWVRYFAEPSA